MLAPSTSTLTTGPRLAEKRKSTALVAGSYDRGLELDFGLQPVLLLVLPEHAVQGAIDGVVVDVSAGAQTGMAAKCIEAHPGVAGDGDLSHARSRSRGHAKGNVGKLLVGVRRDGMRDRRFVIAVFFERGAHLLERARSILAWVKRVPASSWQARWSCVFIVAPVAPSTLTVPINVRGVPEKDQRHAVGFARALDLDGVIKPGTRRVGAGFVCRFSAVSGAPSA